MYFNKMLSLNYYGFILLTLLSGIMAMDLQLRSDCKQAAAPNVKLMITFQGPDGQALFEYVLINYLFDPCKTSKLTIPDNQIPTESICRVVVMAVNASPAESESMFIHELFVQKDSINIKFGFSHNLISGMASDICLKKDSSSPSTHSNSSNPLEAEENDDNIPPNNSTFSDKVSSNGTALSRPAPSAARSLNNAAASLTTIPT